MLVVISCLQPDRALRSSLWEDRDRAQPQFCPRAPSAHRNANRSVRPARVSGPGGGCETGTERGLEMVSLDFRTRTEADIRPVDTRTFFDEELPALIDERSALAVAGARELGVEPFT